MGLLSTEPALAATVRPESLLAIDSLIDDDPRAAIIAARAQLGAAGGPAERFWALLGLARAQNMLELSAEAGKSLAEAETALVALAGSDTGAPCLAGEGEAGERVDGPGDA